MRLDQRIPASWVKYPPALTRQRPASLSAYEIAVRAWANIEGSLANGDPGSRDQALSDAKRALAIDPNSVLALCTLAYVQWNRIFFKSADDPQTALLDGIAAAKRAIDLDSAFGQGHWCAGLLLLAMGQGEQALISLRRAIDLNSDDVAPYIAMGLLQQTAGAADQAIMFLQRALRICPKGHYHLTAHGVLSLAHFFAKNYLEAQTHALTCVTLFNPGPPHLFHALALVGLGKIADANTSYELARQLEPAFVESRLRGDLPYRNPEHRHRYRTFLRIAAGLEDPSAADALR